MKKETIPMRFFIRIEKEILWMKSWVCSFILDKGRDPVYSVACNYFKLHATGLKSL